MAKVFIVRFDNDAGIISRGTLENDIINTLRRMNDGAKVKAKDITSYANDVIIEYYGMTMSPENYDALLDTAARTLITYSELTPYKFLEILNQNNR